MDNQADNPQTRAEYSNLPELVPGEYHNGGLPQQVPAEADPSSGLNKVESWDQHGARSRHVATAPPPFWKRRRVWIPALVAVVVVVALIIGLTVGLLRRNASSSSSEGPFGTPMTFSSDDTSKPSSCRGTICPSTLSIAQQGTAGGLFVFARGSDRAIWYRQASQNAWSGGWKSLGGDFNSQPTAVAVGTDRVDVLAVASGGDIRMQTYQGGQWAEDWLALGGDSINAVAACFRPPDAVDVFGTNAEGLLTYRTRAGDAWQPALDQDWKSFSGYTSAAPAAVCGNATRVDVVSYGGYSGSLHDVGWMHSNSSGSGASGTANVNQTFGDGWEGNFTPGSGIGFRGDPALVRVDGLTTGVLGVGSDKRVYYREYSARTRDYGETESLGGAVESVPFALASANGRLDVLAVAAANDTLVHKARVDGVWATDWENLGGYFEGVPVAVRSDAGWIAVFGIGPGGHAIHGNWSVSDGFVWGEGRWFDDSGDLSTDWFRAGPAR